MKIVLYNRELIILTLSNLLLLDSVPNFLLHKIKQSNLRISCYLVLKTSINRQELRLLETRINKEFFQDSMLILNTMKKIKYF